VVASGCGPHGRAEQYRGRPGPAHATGQCVVREAVEQPDGPFRARQERGRNRRHDTDGHRPTQVRRCSGGTRSTGCNSNAAPPSPASTHRTIRSGCPAALWARGAATAALSPVPTTPLPARIGKDRPEDTACGEPAVITALRIRRP